MALSVEDLPLHQLDATGRRAVCTAVVRAARTRSGAAGIEPHVVLRQLADELDQLLRALWQGMTEEGELASLVALGGYGRQELYPFSDIDLLILHKDLSEERTGQLVEQVVYPLWDAQVSVGHAARTVAETLELAASDLTMRTALLDARMIAGDWETFSELVIGAQREFFGPERVNHFVDALAQERAARHDRFGESVYLLEPNVKSNKGGLRDVNTALWAAKARFGVNRFEELPDHGAATTRQANALAGAHRFLQRLRLAMHLDAKRTQDQLLFDLQERLAPELYPEGEIPGIRQAATVVTPAVERLMHAFYRHALTVVVETEGLLERCQLPDDEAPPEVEPLDEHFVAVGSWLACPSPERFWQCPSDLLRAFQLAHDRGLRVDRKTRDAMAEALAGDPGLQLQADDDAARIWLELLCRDDVDNVLREMHDLGLIAAIIPEFGPCTGRVQHDVYHVYTVDQHTLFVVRMLHELMRQQPCETCPGAVEAMRQLEDRRAVLLAALLHDVAKPLGSGHAAKGARLAAGVVARLGLPAEQQQRVIFLVREHLTMAHISQRRDLQDPKVIDSLAELVGDHEGLRGLYLLSVADTAMTCPGNLTSWKAALLDELYLRCGRRLAEGTDAGESASDRRREIFEAVSSRRGEEGARWVTWLPDRFFNGTTSSSRLEEQLEPLLELADDSEKVIRLGVRSDDAGHTELTLCCPDAPGLLAKITGSLATHRIEVLAAQIYTLAGEADPAIAFDIFSVQAPDQCPWPEVEQTLQGAIRGEIAVSDGVARLRSSLPPRALPPVRTTVTFDNEASTRSTALDVRGPDRPGLLHLVTRELSDIGLSIQLAMITTASGHAVDSFYVQDGSGGKITDATLQAEIAERIEKVVRGES